MSGNPANWPELTFPPEEAEKLEDAYMAGRVILEYGSGGSTVLAAGLPGKLVFSVESDRMWALRLQAHIDAQDLPSPATVFHADIGPTGAWGRPVDDKYWARFHTYPLSIWDAPFFRHPDVVLIDGRFRAACMMTVMMRMTRPVTVLFDDYAKRRPYHMVENWVKPREMAGRMAIFDVLPGLLGPNDFSQLNKALGQATYVGKSTFYDMGAEQAIERRLQNDQELE